MNWEIVLLKGCLWKTLYSLVATAMRQSRRSKRGDEVKVSLAISLSIDRPRLSLGFEERLSVGEEKDWELG